MSKLRVLVGVKRVIDYAVRVRVSADKSGVELANTKMSMNPFCEIACEEAIQLKEKGVAEEVARPPRPDPSPPGRARAPSTTKHPPSLPTTAKPGAPRFPQVAVSIGPKQAQETLRSALAMGCDRAVHVATDARLDQDLNPLAVARLLAAVVAEQKPDVVIVGKQAIDGDNATTGPMLAELLGWSQATFAAELDVDADGSAATVERETDAGTEVVKVALPTVVTADLRLNTPRYPKLPNIMKAKKKPLEVLDANDLGVDLAPTIVVESVAAPPDRAAGITVDSVDALVDKLKNEAAVI